MLASNLSRGLLSLNRVGVLTKSRSVLYSKHYRGEFWDKNINRLHRPLSPHIFVAYKLPFTAQVGFAFKCCGIGMTLSVMLFGIGSFYFAGNFDKICDQIQKNYSPSTLLAGKYLISFPIVYHPLIGLRHLIWDSGRFFNLAGINKSNYAIIILALIGTHFLANAKL